MREAVEAAGERRVLVRVRAATTCVPRCARRRSRRVREWASSAWVERRAARRWVVAASRAVRWESAAWRSAREAQV